MQLRTELIKKVFHFGFDARTSRGRMKDKTSWFIKLRHEDNPNVFGLGESGPLPGLSVDDRPDFEEVLSQCVERVPTLQSLNDIEKIVPPGFPSIRFGFETAWLDLHHGGVRKIYDTPFVTGAPIPINGLVWMGDLDTMLQQVSIKIAQGFRCIKIKVGGLNFEKECDILQYIRSKYFREGITIRLDANGAFKPEEAIYKLTTLARYNIHSIEQPVKPGLGMMEDLCEKSPIPIALDEELIGVETKADKIKLLDRIKPQFIILKPTLHGGLVSCAEWIALAEERSIGWWITSALESNIGLNAICQFTANYETALPQGLGTGQIYEDNFPSPLTVSDGTICYDQKKIWDLQELG
ncbi:MAG TPA: o-succinylbenzoate synthase [Cyclobacteriaceae bacterium]|nr:o-succinylbenzoate synthase [Cyclobacteriaceae bacterium]HRJ82083.1 o-succinylbenzoate synthase [Cyclobacteriaceae bacterium]